MPKLTDTHALLLSAASQREDGSLYPLPENLRAEGGLTNVLVALVHHGLAEERRTSDPSAAAPADGDLPFGLFVTRAGLTAIGVKEEAGAALAADTDDAANPSTGGESAGSPNVPVSSDEEREPPRQTKSAEVLALLARKEGATLAELIGATGWLPHTARAALTGVRKKGHAVERSKRGKETCYRIAQVEA